MVGTVILATFLLLPVSKPVPAIKFRNSEQLKSDQSSALQIYWYVCASMAREMNSKPFEPQIEVLIGADENAVVTSDGLSTIKLKVWNEELFAQGVGVAWAAQFVTPKRIEAGTKDALLNWRMTIVDVKDLRKARR
jgi:hypothetical protein